MKFLINNKNVKKISLLLITIIVFSIISPIMVCAKEDEDTTFGGKLFGPISKLICGIGDGVIMFLQRTFLGYSGIKDEQFETGMTKSTVYQILYSPGIIFSNKVPALNANFINPSKEKYQLEISKTAELNEIDKSSYSYQYREADANLEKEKEKECLNAIKAGDYGYSASTRREIQGTEQKYNEMLNSVGMPTGSVLYQWEYDKNNDGKKETYYLCISTTTASDGSAYKPLIAKRVEYALYGDSLSVIEKGEEIEYSASVLQGIISKWYKGLRLIAMVGLLSVLVYVGIRIIISSTGQEKAKYKKMIGDWLAAICILFVLQYIMSFTVTIVSELIDIFPTVQGELGEDTLMSELRNIVHKADGTFWNVFGETVMYVALVILTCVFTVHYLKRFVYLAFLTMIAPLIALTYPLDKIKDGQAQAFGMWIKEYVFNSLIPVIHILIYTIFVTSATELVETNPLYAVVCIGFIIPAEKFIRKMFGFDKATTSSQLGAAAGGAMVMNAINKFGSNAQGGSNGSAGNGATGKPSGVRTATNSPYQGLQTGANPPANPPPVNPPPANPPPANPPPANPPPANPPPGNPPPVNPPPVNPPPGNPPVPSTKDNLKKYIRGVGTGVSQRLFSKEGVKKNLSNIGKIAGGAAGLALGVGATVASGDASNLLKYVPAATIAGAKGTGGLVNRGFDSLVGGVDNIRYQGRAAISGYEVADQAKFDREFKRSKEYKDLVRNYSSRKGVRDDIQKMLDSGISDPQTMNTILKNVEDYNSRGSNISIEHGIAYNQLAKNCSDSIMTDDTKFRKFLNYNGITNVTDLDALRQSITDFK